MILRRAEIYFLILPARFLVKTLISVLSKKKKWYFVTKLVLTYCEKNCSSDREKLLKFKAEGCVFAIF